MKLKIDFIKKFTLMLALLALANIAWAQNTVSGTVTDAENGEPLIGATVVVVGTTTGTITDFDGKFTINVPEGATQLEFSYTGYSNMTVDLGADAVVNVEMSAGTLLDEVVVVGYGTVKKSDLTGSVTSVKAEDFNKGVVTAPDQLIQGKVAGVQIVGASGAPGAESTIRVRGSSSVRTGNQPLFVVDGIPLDGRSVKPNTDIGGGLNNTPGINPLSFINPNDIASIEVLKDASATAIYGSRGANGVIIVTTKKGTSGDPTIDVNVSAGVSSILNSVDVLNGDEYRAALQSEGVANPDLGDFGDDVDAFDEILRTGSSQNYDVAIGGGNARGNYRVSASYLNQQGIIKETGLKKYTANLRGSYKFFNNDRVRVDVGILATHTDQQSAPITNDAGFVGSLIGMALQWNPTRALFNSDGSFDLTESNSTINPLAMLEAYDDRTNITRILASIAPTVNLAEGLDYKFLFSIDQGQGVRDLSINSFINLDDIQGRGLAVYGNNRLTTQQFTHTLSYNRGIAEGIDLGAVVGYEYQKYRNRGISVQARDFLTDNVDYNNFFQNSSQVSRDVRSFEDPTNELQSFFGRANININDKYLITGTFRADGSSKFGENNRYGYFPSAAVAWNLVSEGFLPDAVDNLKLRVGWGVTGNQEFPAGSAQERWGFDPDNNGNFRLENVANPDLKWETSSTINVGIDFGFLDYKITGSIDYFNKTTEDLLFQLEAIQPAPATNLWVNLPGQVRNSGLELALNTFLVDNENVSWQFGINGAFLSNELEDYVGPPVETGGINGQGLSGVRAQRLANGQPLYVFLIRNFEGFDESGNAIYANDSELQFVGDPNPDVLLGITSSVNFGDFDFGINFNGAFGHQIYNNTANAILVKGNLGTRNTTPDVVGNGESTANPNAASSRYLEDGDYLRLTNATFGYNVGSVGNWAKNIRLYVTGQNLLLFTNYTGFDPEVNTNKEIDGVPSFGIEYTPYPTARNIIFGASVSF
ncbi:MAG: SusC/RagA family TonB-linked outer membrane protein [Bacteroidota bacterium]